MRATSPTVPHADFPHIKEVRTSVYRVPTDAPESDGTLTWDHTEVVVVSLTAGNVEGLGWTYASRAAAALIEDLLASTIKGQTPANIEALWWKMLDRLRNAGRPGAGMMAVAAVDVALWDLKAKLLNLPLVDLLGAVREEVPIYASGGFTSYTEKQLRRQLGGWAEAGMRRVKMKVGRDAEADPQRVRAARKAIGERVELFVDANGAYGRQQALALAARFFQERVLWFEEPRPSNDLAGLRMLRDGAPAGMEIAAGEYGDTPDYFGRMLSAGAVDCLQADVTRCGGYTGFLKVGALCDSSNMPLSAHCAPQLHAHVGCAVHSLRHVEYFHDHIRIERIFFDGILKPRQGALKPDRRLAGHGMRLRAADADPYRL